MATLRIAIGKTKGRPLIAAGIYEVESHELVIMDRKTGDRAGTKFAKLPFEVTSSESGEEENEKMIGRTDAILVDYPDAEDAGWEDTSLFGSRDEWERMLFVGTGEVPDMSDPAAIADIDTEDWEGKKFRLEIKHYKTGAKSKTPGVTKAAYTILVDKAEFAAAVERGAGGQAANGAPAKPKAGAKPAAAKGKGRPQARA